VAMCGFAHGEQFVGLGQHAGLVGVSIRQSGFKSDFRHAIIRNSIQCILS
jgi:hypothetical protein